MIYIHVPFCHRKCSYCAFYSVASSADHTAYVSAICAEAKQRQLFFGDSHHRVETIYLGGGTPSMLDAEMLKKIFDTLEQHFDLSTLREVTLECNPEDLTDHYLENIESLGYINRLSIGVQSFDDHFLRMLNRRHSGEMARQAIVRAAQHGFRHLSVDLIYGLPRQNLQQWQQELKTIEQINSHIPHPVGHLSCYALTVEPGTILERQIAMERVSAADEEVTLQHYAWLREWVMKQGYRQYEISNFAMEGEMARHNQRYWRRDRYLGLGAAAHSFDGLRRRWNIADVTRYTTSTQSGSTHFEEETLTPRDAYNEYVMTALRTVEGIEKKQVAADGKSWLQQRIRRWIEQGLIVEDESHYRPTPEGLLHADGIAANLFML